MDLRTSSSYQKLQLLQFLLQVPNMTSKCYADSSNVSPQSFPNFSPIVMKIALPLKKDSCKSYKMIDQTFLQAASAVMVAIPIEILSNITSFCSIIERKSKINLQSIKVNLPYCYKSQASKLLSEGIQMGNKRLLLYSIVEPEGAEYPKRVTISFRNLPNFCTASTSISTFRTTIFQSNAKYSTTEASPTQWGKLLLHRLG